MTTLELFKKHRKGEVSRERFLYEVRRDNNLPWITNTTSYNDAVKILKNKGIIRESAVVPENTMTAPEVDRVNPYFLKKGVQKELENRTDLNNNSYEEALNKAAKKLAKDPHAFDDLLIHNASDIHKKDQKLEMKPVKKGNHVDKDNGMKKMKGQEAPKAMSAPTKENKKTKKPKGVKVMPDKGVEGSPKIIKEISEFIKKKLAENNSYHDYHVGMQVETAEGTCTIKEINGGTLTVETKDGKLMDVQMNHAKHFTDKKKEGVEESSDQPIKEIDHKESVDKLYDALDRLETLPDEVKTPEILDLIEKIKAKIDQLHDYDNYPTPTEDEMQGFQENEASLRGGLRPYHDPTSQLTGTGKPNVTGPMPTDDLDDETDLQIGDRVKVVYGNQFYGMTGTIEDVKGGFVIVNIDEDGDDYSMHSSDVEKIGEEEDDDQFYGEDDLAEAIDFNDPALVASRARIEKYRTTPKQSLANYSDDKDKDFEILQQIKQLKREKAQTLIDMEQEAEPEGGPIADDYADRLMDLDRQIKALEAELYMEEGADVVSYVDASSGQKKIAGIYPSGKGSSEVSKLKTSGVTTATVDQAK